jgi:tetratricopeptide (TPR) repeat protein
MEEARSIFILTVNGGKKPPQPLTIISKSTPTMLSLPSKSEAFLTMRTSIARVVAFLEYAVGRQPTYEGCQLLAAALSHLGRKTRAAKLLEKSIRINPDSWEAYYRLGYIYTEIERYEEAAAMFEKVLERQPRFPEVEKQFAGLRQKLPAQSVIH